MGKALTVFLHPRRTAMAFMELEAELAQAHADCLAAISRAEAAEGALASATENAGNQLAVARGECEELTQKLADAARLLDEERRQQRADLEEIERSIAAMQAALDRHRARNAELRRRLAEARAEIAELRGMPAAPAVIMMDSAPAPAGGPPASAPQAVAVRQATLQFDSPAREGDDADWLEPLPGL